MQISIDLTLTLPTLPARIEWYSVGRAARVCGATPTAVRYWTKEMQIPVRRTSGNDRRYSRLQVLRLAALNRLIEMYGVRPHQAWAMAVEAIPREVQP